MWKEGWPCTADVPLQLGQGVPDGGTTEYGHQRHESGEQQPFVGRGDPHQVVYRFGLRIAEECSFAEDWVLKQTVVPFPGR